MKWIKEKIFSSKLSNIIKKAITSKKLSNELLEELENVLILADLGIEVTQNIINRIKKTKFDADVTEDEVKRSVAKIIEDILTKSEKNITLDPSNLNVLLLCGVNGNGKTTTIGKLAHYFKDYKIIAAACDTFRAAAKEQLLSWGERANIEIISADKDKADPGSVAYQGIEQAKKQDANILIVDTAGRLHNNSNLMDELKKINKIVNKQNITNYHKILVLDATTGQNAINQVREFQNAIDISGIIITKLDGTAKAGILVNIVQSFNLPVYFIGCGEKIDDLKTFNAKKFSENLVGI